MERIKRTFKAKDRRFKPERSVRTAFTMRFAENYLSRPPLPGERELKEKRVIELAEKMENGLFMGEDTNIVTVHVMETDTIYRCNGQHTCEARTLFNEEQIQFTVRHTHYSVETLKDAAILYSQFDDPDGKRTFDQVAKPTWAAQGLLELYAKPVLKYATMAIAFDLSGRKRNSIKNIKRDNRIQLPQGERKFLAFLNTIIGRRSESYHLHKSPVVCSMYQCWKKSQASATKFWTQVRDGENLAKNEPAMKIRDFLLRTAHATGKGSLATRKASFEEIYAKVIHSWNAFRQAEKNGRRGKMIYLKYIPGAALPVPR